MGKFSEILKEESKKEYYIKLHEFIEKEYKDRLLNLDEED